METIINLGLGLVGTIVKLVQDAKNASTEEHAAILARLEAADKALTQAQHDAHASVDEETKKTAEAIASAERQAAMLKSMDTSDVEPLPPAPDKPDDT